MNAVRKIDYLFRPMQAVDLDAILNIEPTLYLHPWTRGNFNDSLTSGHVAWVMTRGDEVIAYALMMIVLDEAQLLNISVATPYQKQGLGQALLAHLLDNAKALKVIDMFLEVRASNAPAIALYERMAFAEVSVRRGYYPGKEGREDAVIMRVVL